MSPLISGAECSENGAYRPTRKDRVLDFLFQQLSARTTYFLIGSALLVFGVPVLFVAVQK